MRLLVTLFYVTCGLNTLTSMKTDSSPQTSVLLYQTTRRQKSQDLDLHGHGHWKFQISQNDLMLCTWVEFRAEKSIVLEFCGHDNCSSFFFFSETWRHVFRKTVTKISVELVLYTSHPFTMKIEATDSSEILINLYQTTRFWNWEWSNVSTKTDRP